MLSKYVWDNIAQEDYLYNVSSERTDILFQIYVLPNHNITKQSSHFLFDGGLGVHLWLVGQQWEGADID